MGRIEFNAYVLVVRGFKILPFLDGLSTNHVRGPCTSVFTDKNAKIIDVCEILVIPHAVVLVGYAPHKDALVQHLLSRILGRDINITDISHLNRVYIETSDEEIEEFASYQQGFFGRICVSPVSNPLEITMNVAEWNEYRIEHSIPFYGTEITQNRHPFACGLESLVHQQKGCYIGQEILTRMRSRNRQGHHMIIQDNPCDNVTTLGALRSICIVRDQ